MPSCAAHGCRSRPENGFRLFKLPSDPQRRQIWLEKMGRQDDQISSSAKLCEMHFLNDQFENKRQDGKKLLRWNAVPTEFSHCRKPGEGQPAKGHKTQKARSSLTELTPPRECAEADKGEVGQLPSTRSEHTYAAFDGKSSVLGAEDHVASDTYGDENAGAGYCCSPEIMEPAHSMPTLAGDHDPASWKLRRDLTLLQRRHQALRASNAKLSRQLLQLKSRARQVEQKLGVFLSKDQIAKLGQKSTRGSLWSRASVMSALKLKFSCGSVGYGALLGARYPLPSVRTLNRRLQTLAFDSGVLHEAFDMLRAKVEHMAEKERLCSLALVEAPVSPGFQHDRSTAATIGAVTLPGHTGTATRGLVFALSGLASRWKQTVAYYLVDDATNGEVYKPIVVEIVTRAHSVGLHVCSVSSTMEGPSRAMWSAFGVRASVAEVVNRVAHPCRPQEFLYFCPDAAHLLKRIWAALLNHQVAFLGPEHAATFALPGRVIAVEHLKQLAVLQGGRELKMAPCLSEEALSVPRLEGMRPERAGQLAGRDVTATLRCLVQFHGWPVAAETTAWFLDFVHDWFQHMTSRHPVLALSKLSAEQYLQALDFLRSVLDVFQALCFGPGGAWEPVQSAVLLATTTVLQLQEDLLERHHFSYVLTARFGQDLSESEAAAIRPEGSAPSALLFKRRLSSLAVSQYLLAARGHPDVPQTHRNRRKVEEEKPSGNVQPVDWAREPEDCNISTLNDLATVSGPLDDIDRWCLYSLGGHVIAAAKKKHAFCRKCLAQVAAENGEGVKPRVHRFVALKQFRDGQLAFPTGGAFALLCRAEETFRVQRVALKGQPNLAQHVLELTMKHAEDIVIADCHQAKRRLLEEFLSIRQQISAKFMAGNSQP